MPDELIDVSHAERLLALRTAPAFDALSATELWRIAPSLRPRRFAPGESITIAGMPLGSLQFIVSGRVDVLDQKSHEVLGPRDVIGDLVALLDEAPAPRAVANEPTLTLEFDRAALEDLLEDDFSIFLGVLRATARRLVQGGRAAPGARLALEHEADRRKSNRPTLDLVERVLLLEECDHLRHCEIAALATLAEGATHVVLPRGAPLFPTGKPADHFVVVASGHAILETPAGPRRVSAGAELGMIEALAGETISTSANAETTLQALRIAGSSLIDVVEDYPSSALGLLRALAQEVESPEVRKEDGFSRGRR